MDRRNFMVGTALGVLALAARGVYAQEAAAPPLNDFPREQTLILHNPESTIRNPGWFNIWVAAGGGTSTGLQQLSMDTLWFIDPDAGIDGPIYNALATGPAEYNADFSEMTVKLREGIKWSDGEDFNADDVVYTVEAQMKTPGMVWSGAFTTQVASVEAVDPYTVHFKLKAPNSRFHSIFSVRWNGAWIMPEHVFSKVADITKFDFNPPVSLGAYTLNSFDPNGTWYIWEKRADWQATTLGLTGEPKPQFAVYRNNIPIDNRLIEMRNGNLDVIHDLSPEGTFSIIADEPSARGWFPGFPYAHPDPTLPSVIFNHQNPKFADKRVRWALALMLDARAISMASYRGAATLSPIAIPPTGTHPRDYHAPMQQWLTDFELDTGTQKLKPYDPQVGVQIAEMVRPQYGEQVPTDETAIRNAFGYGWWKQNMTAAAELLTAAGFTQNGSQWTMPDGQPFAFTLLIPPEGVINRLGTMVAQNWQQGGVQVELQVASDHGDLRNAGNFESYIWWSVETWGGHPDLSYFLDSWHSQYVAPKGTVQPARNWQRWSDPRLDAIIEKIRKIDFNDPLNVEYGQEYAKLMVEEMPIIPVMSYNVFAVVSDRYWTGFPGSENPYANTVNNWANSRYIFTQIKPKA